MRKIALIVMALLAAAGLTWGVIDSNTEDTATKAKPATRTISVSPAEQPAPSMPDSLKSGLTTLGYKAEPVTSHISEGGSRRFDQKWEKPGEPTVYVMGRSGGSFEIDIVAYDGVGEWTMFVCSPVEGETPIQAINTGKNFRGEVLNDTAPISRETWMGDNEAQIKSSLTTCYLRK